MCLFRVYDFYFRLYLSYFGIFYLNGWKFVFRVNMVFFFLDVFLRVDYVIGMCICRYKSDYRMDIWRSVDEGWFCEIGVCLWIRLRYYVL